jgi:hypothetical protein
MWNEVPLMVNRPQDNPDPVEIEISERFRLLAEAIDNRYPVQAYYKTETAPRILCPIRIGVTAAGHYLVEAYQIAGPSESVDRSPWSELPDWRTPRLVDLHGVSRAPFNWQEPPPVAGRSRSLERIVWPPVGD